MKKSKGQHGKSEQPERMQDQREVTDSNVALDAGAAATGGDRPEDIGGTASGEDSIEALKDRVASLEDKLLRAKADYQNLLRRSSQERADAVRFANSELVRSLLPVVDDFERALAANEETDDPAAFADGVKLVYDNLIKALQVHGLNVIEARHCPFDPHQHEAMLQQPSADHPPGTVLEEVAKGYRLHDRVIRPARVIVSKSVESTTSDDNETRPGQAAEPDAPSEE